MFAQTFLEGPARTNRGWTVLVSCFLQCGIVLLLIAVPLMKPEVLPRVLNFVTISAPPAPLPPAPPVVETARQRPRPSMVAGRLIAYHHIPAKVLMTTDEVPDASRLGVGGGTEQGIPNGPSNGVVDSVLTNAPVAAPPLAVVAPHTDSPKPAAIRIKVGGMVQDALLINKVLPIYPPLAVQTRTSGTVRFTAVISREGAVTNLSLVSGHPLLVQAATNAVRQWRYRPTYLNGETVEVITTIDVHFILGR
jgi:periplasmic protein TonB